MINITHVGLVILNSTKTMVVDCMTMKSKFERQLGDIMVVDGKKYVVGVIGQSRNEVVDYLNSIIKLQNKNIRKQNKIANHASDMFFAGIMRNVCERINNDLKNI
ncbi:hypothetical protein OAB94_01880 [Flavobacteriaceae bacterium]|nr:hypothetical protein [Flavobacteriaceae bacterium]